MLATVLTTELVPADQAGAATAPAATTPTTKWYFFKGSKVDDQAWFKYNAPSRGWRRDWIQMYGDSVHLWQKGRQGSAMCMCKGKNKSTKPYGEWEVYARGTKGSGFGLAMLLWPTSNNSKTGGELDIAEMNTFKRDTVGHYVHYTANNGDPKYKALVQHTDGTKWHRYGVKWTSTYIEWTVDGKAIWRMTDAYAIPKTPMNLVLQAQPDNRYPTRRASVLDVKWVKITR